MICGEELLCRAVGAGIRSWRFAAVFFLLAARPTAVAAPENSSNPFAVETWQTDNGLPQNSVTAVLQGADGYIYAGTYNGMVRFDGVRFVTFDSANTPALRNSRVTGLYQDDNGVIWLGHETGEVSWMDRGQFHSMEAGADWPGAEIVGFGSDQQNDVWALNRDGVLLRLRDGKILQPPAGVAQTPPGAAILARQKNGVLWMVYRGAVATLDHARWAPFRFGSPDPQAYFECLCPSRDGGLWVAGERQIRKWNGDHWTRNLGSFPWDQSAITCMRETRSGQLLVGTLDSGLYILGPGDRVSHLSRTNGLPHDWIRCMAEDREGNLWVGTSGGGLCVLRARKVTMFNPPDDWQGRGVLSVARGPADQVWAGTEGAGVYEFASGRWSHFDSADGLSNLFVWSMLQDRRGRVWAGTWGGGLFEKTRSGFELPAALRELSTPVTALMEGRSGELLVGTAEGLLRVGQDRVQWLVPSRPNKALDIRALAEDTDGTIWFGMNSGGGVGRWHNGRTRTFTKQDGLASNFILCLHLDGDHTLWIGTLDNGLCRFKDGKFATVNSGNGLASDAICGIADDSMGNFWISSLNGIFRVSKTELSRCADRKAAWVQCLVYGRRQGLATLACSGGFQPEVCRTADGRLWFPTGKGLAVIDPRAVRPNRIRPPVWIEEALVDGQPARIARAGAREALAIGPGLRRIQFHFSAPSFTSPDRVQFKYRLRGFERDWVQAGNQREADYNYLPPGRYVLRVIACNNDGLWNEQGATLALTVLPHVWQTAWFRFSAGAAALLLVGGTVLLVGRRRMRLKLERLERQHALERERSRIAKDIHDDLGASLTQITMLSQSAAQALDRPEQAGRHLTQIFGAARSSTRALDEIVWAVNPKHDSLDSMATYLVKFAQEFMAPASIRCRFEMPLQFPHRALTAELRHNVFLAYKEALNNIVKHAAAREVRISMALTATGFSLGIADDGRGFDPATPPAEAHRAASRNGGGNGLGNMRRRLREVGGTFEMASTPGAGTRVTFLVAISSSGPTH